MKARWPTRWFCALGAAALLLAGAASAADVHVMISAGFYKVYSELGPAFERASGHRLVTTRGPSMGDSPEAIPTRLARGEAADVLILDGGAADELDKRGLVRAGSKVELARSQIGMVVRAGAAKPDIGSVEAFRGVLLAAKSIAYSDSGSGTYLSTTLFAKLGVADQVAGKSRKVRGPPSGEPVAAVVARGEAEIGFQQVSELIHVAGVTFVGAIPAELQPGFSFAGAITHTSREPGAASVLLRFLASPEAASTISKAGLTPLSRNPATQLHAADLRVISGGAAQQVLQALSPKFESASGNTVELSFAVVGAIQQRLMAGEKGDVLLLPVPLLDALEKAGAFHARSRTAMGRVAIGVVAREGASVPDISSSDAVRKMLLEARSVAFPDPKLTPSGSHLIRVFEQLGIAEEMRPKVTFRNAIDGGVNLVRDGDVEIGLFLVTEVLPVKGIKLIGTLPQALQGYVVYGAAVAADSRAADKASELVKFLSEPGVREHWKAAGFEFPAGGGR